MNKAIDVCIFVESLNQGGAERVVSILANQWAKAGLRVAIATPEPASMDAYDLDISIVRKSSSLDPIAGSIFNRVVGHLKRIFWYRQTIRIIKPRICIAFMVESIVWQHFACGLLLQKHPFRIGAERSDPDNLSGSLIWRLLRRWSYARLHRVVAQTSDAAYQIEKFCPRSLISVIPNPVLYPIPIRRPVFSVLEDIPRNRKVLLSICRLSKSKQVDLLIEIFSRLQSSCNSAGEWVLVIAGEGQESQRLKDLAKHHSVANQVIFTGRVGNVHDLYQRADIFCMTSAQEGFPNGLAEALVYGLPCVAFDCNYGPRDLILDHINGILVPINDTSQLLNSIQRLMESEELRKKYSANFDITRDRLSAHSISASWLNFFPKCYV